MIERVRNNRIIRPQQSLEQPPIRIKTRRIEDRVFHSQKACDLSFQCLVLFLCAADESHRRHPEAIAVERGFPCLCQVIAIGQPEIIVGAKVQNLRAPDRNLTRLFRGDDAFGLIQPGVFQPINLRAEMLDKRGHRVFLRLRSTRPDSG